ncbi:MAG: glycosyltransferase [Thermoanaerobaculia bacterium]
MHVIGYLHHEASGPTQSVASLAQSEARLGCIVDILCAGPGARIDGVAVTAHRELRADDGMAIAPGLLLSLLRRRSVDVIHNHGLWSAPNFVVALTRPALRSVLVTSPRGTLSPAALGFSQRKKQLFWWMQRPVITSADCVHVTSEAEADDVRRLGVKKPVAVLPNPIALPDLQRFPSNRSAERTILFVGRLHPIKGLDLLLQAWNDVSRRFPEWRLKIAGVVDPQYMNTLRRQAADLQLKRCDFVGPVYGDEKFREYRAADIVVLPSRSENFGMVVGESLACEVPVITTTATPWHDLGKERAGWCVDPAVPALSGALQTAMSMTPGELHEIGKNGRAWMERDYSPESVGQKMIDVYKWLLGRGARPAWVIE